MNTLSNNIYHYQNGEFECIRIAGANGADGVQICTGKLAFSRPASVLLNGSSTAGIYTGVKEYDTSATDCESLFAKAFAEAPIVVVAPKGNNYWLGDALADSKGITRLDFYTNARFAQNAGNPLDVTLEYMAIGKAGSDTTGMTAYTGAPMLHSKNGCVQIPYQLSGGSYTGIQICEDSFSSKEDNVAISATVNDKATIYSARPTMAADDFPHAFTATPRIFAAPSLACQNWLQSSKNADDFEHSYWFGSTTPSTTTVTRQRVYSNDSITHDVRGRYIAIGTFTRASSDTTDWTSVSAVMETATNDNGGTETVVRFGDTTGFQLSFGTFGGNTCDLTAKLNEKSSSIYTGFRNGACLFTKPFSATPSVVVVPNKECRSSQTSFVHPFWFGDAASNAIGIMNLDAYTNKSMSSAQLNGQYVAAGEYQSAIDTSLAYQLVSKAAEYLYQTSYPDAITYEGNTYSGLTLGQAILLLYSVHNPKNPQVTVNSDGSLTYHSPKSSSTTATGWCSEFASEMAEAVGISEDIFPHTASGKKFCTKLTDIGSYYTPDTGSDSDSITGTFGGVTPSMGDLLFIDEDSDGTQHTCLIVNVNGSYANTVEGNIGLTKGIAAADRSAYFRRRKIKGTNSLNVKGIGHINW